MESKPSKAEDSCSIDHSVIEMETGFGWFPAPQEDDSSDAEDSGVVGKSDPHDDIAKDEGAASKDGPHIAVEIAGTSGSVSYPEVMVQSRSAQPTNEAPGTIDEKPGPSQASFKRKTTRKWESKGMPSGRQAGQAFWIVDEEMSAEKPGSSKPAFKRESTRKRESKGPPSTAREAGQRIRNVNKEMKDTSEPSLKRKSTRKYETIELQTTAGNVEQDPGTIHEEIGVEVEPRRVQLTSLRAENKKKELKAERRRKRFLIFVAILTCVTLGISLYSFINSLQVINETQLDIKKILKTRAIRKAKMEELKEGMTYLPLLIEDEIESDHELEKFTAWFERFCGISWDGTCFRGIVRGRWFNYTQAEATCARNEGKLPYVRDESHYKMTVLYLRSIIPKYWSWIAPWLGMKYNASTGNVTLSNGNPAPYVKWYPGDPDPTWSSFTLWVDIDPSDRDHGMANDQPTFQTYAVLCEIGSE